MSPRGKALLACAVTAALIGLELWRLAAPAPAPADAPAEAFSATRAIATLHKVFVDEPHPLGTPAHDVVRDRIAAELRALDYEVAVQRVFACNAYAVCGDVDNIVATIPGQRGDRAIAIATHYDSVPAGPGASDDATGVATALEVARAIRREAFANRIVFLVDDGEESGLLGAEGFVADPARADVAFVINVEARGTSGTPFLFETSRDNRAVVPVFARALPHPVTTSLFATIYDRLPNDTDLTVFKRAGRAGINFAYLGDGTQYHTPLDNFANVDEGTVQWRGDQVLAMVRAYGNAQLATAPGDAVWFDVFAAFVIWWPAGWSIALAVLGLALAGAAIALGRRRGQLGIAGVALGGASFVGAIALAVALGSALAWVLGLRDPGALFVPHPEWMIAAAWCAGLAGALAAAALARRRASFDALVCGHAVAWNALAAALAVALPGAAYIAIVPGVLMAAAALLRATTRTGEEPASIAPLVGAAAVLFPFALVVYDAIGGGSVTAIAVMLALVGTTFAPMVAGTARRTVPVLIAATAGLAVIALQVPNASPSHPHQLSIAHVSEVDAGTARWQTDALAPLLHATARFEPRKRTVAPWYGPFGVAYIAPAPTVALAPPAVTAVASVRDGVTVITIDAASVRRAPRLSITWHSDAPLDMLRINGVTPPPRPARFRAQLAPGWHRVQVRGSTARVEIALRGAAPETVIVSDTSFGLPAIAAPLSVARDAGGAVPVRDGDVTVIERRVRVSR